MVYHHQYDDDLITRLSKTGAPSEEKIIKKLESRSISRPLLRLSTNPNLVTVQHRHVERQVRIVVSIMGLFSVATTASKWGGGCGKERGSKKNF